jgi:hypothetical protein
MHVPLLPICPAAFRLPHDLFSGAKLVRPILADENRLTHYRKCRKLMSLGTHFSQK